MSRLTRRGLIAGGAVALAGLAAAPFALRGVEGFLRRVVADHFGEDALAIEGIDEFIAEFAATAGKGDALKRIAAKTYFAARGDRIVKLSRAQAFEEQFLRTILKRSNIIALRQGQAEDFDWQNPDPWDPQCGLYLSSLAEEAA